MIQFLEIFCLILYQYVFTTITIPTTLLINATIIVLNIPGSIYPKIFIKVKLEYFV